MTCIVGIVQKGKVYMGADSAGTDAYYNQQIRRDPKIFRNGDLLIGYCGSFRMGQLLGLGLNAPTPKANQKPENYMVSELIPVIRTLLKENGYAKVENNVEEGGQFLVGYDGRLFNIESDFQVGESDDSFDACGAGAPVALGALYATRKNPKPRDRMKLALEAAARFNASVRPPFKYEVL